MENAFDKTAEVRELIGASKGLILYFYNDLCAPCISLRPKVQEMADVAFPMIKVEFIDSTKYCELNAEFGVFSSPSLLVFFEGKECVRESKYVSIEALKKKIGRYYMMVFGI